MAAVPPCVHADIQHRRCYKWNAENTYDDIREFYGPIGAGLDRRVGRRLTLRDLHILSAVVEWGGMAKAARHLAMSQPAVSDSIASLESVLGVRLLDRSARGVEPTVYANALLRRSAVVFDELRQGIRDIEFMVDPTKGEVPIGCTESLMPGLLSTSIERLSRQYPDIVVTANEVQPTATGYRDLRERHVDLMLGRIFRPLVDDEVAAEMLFNDKYFVVAGEKSPWVRRKKLTLADLIDEPWILISPSNVFGAFVAGAFSAQGLGLPRRRVMTFSHQLRSDLLASGRFLTIVAGEVVRANARRWGMKALPVDLGLPPYSVAIFTVKNRTLSPVVNLFIEHLRAIANEVFTLRSAK